MVAPPKPTFFYVLESLVGSTGAAIHLIYMYAFILSLRHCKAPLRKL